MTTRFDFTAGIALADTEQAIPQLYERLTRKLRQEDCPPGEVLISERTAADRLNISRSAVHKVYTMLCADGFLRRDPGMRNYRICDFTRIDADRNIGIVLPASLREYLSSPVHSQKRMAIYSGVVDYAARSGIGTRIINLPEPGSPKSEIDRFFEDTIPNLLGVIHFGDRGPDFDPVLDRLWANESVPQVLIFSRNKYAHCGSVSFDNSIGLQYVAQHLIDCGHRDLAIFNISPRMPAPVHYTLAKLPLIMELFRKAWMNVRDEWCFSIERANERESIDWATERFLALPNRPSAIWCHNDYYALRLMHNLKEAGFRIPEDFAIVGTENSLAGQEAEPPLTTLQLPFYAMGYQATEMLLRIRRERGRFTQRVLSLTPTLVVRGSTPAAQAEQVYI